MNLFELFVKIGVDDQATKGIKDVEKTMKNAKKPMEDYRKDVMKLAQTYKSQGMDMSSAMKKAYSEIDKSQYETANNSKSDSKKFASNWKDAGDKISGIASKIGKGLKTAAKIGTTALGVAATGITALTTLAVKNYAEYEQLVGGIETLFGAGGKSIEEYAKSVGKSVDDVRDEYDKLIRSQELVMDNASNAYRTATMSANEYMSLATSFSASLLQSLEGDTQKTAEYTDRAIIDISDNASKMGTDIELLKNAYSGFAKGNMTMLDNLKLGYGGTKEEMERLIIDASKMTDIQEKLGITVDASSGSFSNIVNAISVMQESLGISGTTAKEASLTIEGSVNSMKSAWRNLITGIADDNADFETLVNNLVGTLTGTLNEATGEFEGGVINNLFPRIEVALGGIADVVEKLAPIIVEKLPSILEKIIPSLIKTATDSVDAVVKVLPSLLENVVGELLKNAPLLIQAGIDMIEALIGSIQQNKDIIVDGAIKIVTTLVTGVIELLPDLLKLGLDLIIALANGITKAIQDDGFIQTIIDVVLQIVETLTKPETLTNLLNAGLDLLLALVEGLLSEESITALVDAVFLIIENLMAFFYDPENIAKVWDIGIQLIVAIVKGLGMALWRINEGADELSNEFWDTIMNTDWLGLGKDIMNSIWDGLVDVWNSLVDWFSNEFGWFSGWFNDSTDTGGWSGGGGANRNFIDGSHAGGLARVPYDGYIAELHEGERVLTASEAQRYNNSNGYSGSTSTVNVTVGIDDTANAMGLARALLPFLKIAEKEVYA